MTRYSFDDLAGQRFLVTGATGFVGRRLCARLTAQGARVTALVRETSVRSGLPSDARLIVGDLTSTEGAEAVREAADGADCVFHLAAVVKSRSAEGYWHCNAAGSGRLAEVLASLPSPPRLVVCSSLAAAGPARPWQPRTEDEPAAPVSHYGRSKLAGELAVRELAGLLTVVAIRPPIVYGPGDPAFLPSLLPMIRSGLVLKSGFGPRHYSVIHVDDLCTALLAAATRGRTMCPDVPDSGVYTVSDGTEHTWQGICRTVADVLGRRPPLVLPVPHTVTRGVAECAEALGRLRGFVPPLNRDKTRELRCAAWTCSTERARTDLGFVPSIPLAEGIAATLATAASARP
ncbi:NAD(P)-dependent oxidoreductase [Streptomyces sp. ISL-96]|uniref:NAD-dependent epimerase/dehydratase family protein n=1 Tax=Streptomyces sp. ISL-96 TaxID=2819191 RepID=UPI0027E2A355|nr:NAD(P)-dependent oxidoreductase [Streptomyces sp. ISL-96]